MEDVINVKNLLGSDIRSRCTAEALRNEIEKTHSRNISIDMDGVVFVSRSFADELLNIAERTGGRSIRIVNASGDTKIMIDIVSSSRKSERVLSPETGKITELKDMEILKEFFSAM